MPPSARGVTTPTAAFFGADNPASSHLVYVTTDREFARWFASMNVSASPPGHGTLYEVDPAQPTAPDPDFPGKAMSFTTASARILAVAEVGIAPLRGAEGAKRFGPHLTWSDGSPVYDAAGRVQRSPEAIKAGQPQAMWDAQLEPWADVVERGIFV